MAVADPIARLVKELARLPGIGEKTAQRLAFHILKAGPGYANDLASAVVGVVRDVRLCASCQTLTDRDPCPICADPERDGRTVCVVEGVPDLVAAAVNAGAEKARVAADEHLKKSTGGIQVPGLPY